MLIVKSMEGEEEEVGRGKKGEEREGKGEEREEEGKGERGGKKKEGREKERGEGRRRENIQSSRANTLEWQENMKREVLVAVC